jgi:HlyD family secretion protein
MTASLSFQIDLHKNVLRVPNAALRFYPKPEYVRSEDRMILEGDDRPPTDDQDTQTTGTQQRSAMEKAEAGQRRNRRHVWIVDGDRLKAVAIVIGLNDSKHSEVLGGPLHEGDRVVTGVAPATP